MYDKDKHAILIESYRKRLEDMLILKNLKVDAELLQLSQDLDKLITTYYDNLDDEKINEIRSGLF